MALSKKPRRRIKRLRGPAHRYQTKKSKAAVLDAKTPDADQDALQDAD
jgi:hypothetical protein